MHLWKEMWLLHDLSQVPLKSPLVPKDQQKSQYKGQEYFLLFVASLPLSEISAGKKFHF